MTAVVYDVIFSQISTILQTNPHKWDFGCIDLQNKDAVCKLLFYNYTPHHASMRLTNLGFTVIKKLFQFWSCPLPADWYILVQKGNVLLKLQQKIPAPYYWDTKNFHVFHSEVAFEMQMVGNDLSSWLKTF